MSLKKRVSKSIALSLVGVSLAIPVMNSVSAMEPNDEYQSISLIQEDIEGDINKEFEQETRLGGGPSPSAVWESAGTYKVSYTAKQVASLRDKVKAGATAGARTQTAYIAVLTLTGSLSSKIPGVGGIVGGIATYLTFVDTRGNIAKRNYDVLNNAAKAKRTVTVTFRKYKRPANGAVIVEAINWR